MAPISHASAAVRHLLESAGGQQFPARLEEFGALGEDACDALIVAYARADGSTVGSPERHPRDIMDDLSATVVVAARRWPDRFAQHIHRTPALAQDVTVLRALAEIDRDDTRHLLVDAARDTSAGHGYHRQVAIDGLLLLRDPRLPDLLVRLIGDRDSSVRFTAACAAIEVGDARLLPALHRTVAAARTPPGSREFALDAIAAITTRDGTADEVARHRLVDVHSPATHTAVSVTVVSVSVIVADVVAAGRELARVRIGEREAVVTAPSNGIVVSIGVTVGREPRPVMFRLRV